MSKKERGEEKEGFKHMHELIDGGTGEGGEEGTEPAGKLMDKADGKPGGRAYMGGKFAFQDKDED